MRVRWDTKLTSLHTALSSPCRFFSMRILVLRIGKLRHCYGKERKVKGKEAVIVRLDLSKMVPRKDEGIYQNKGNETVVI